MVSTSRTNAVRAVITALTTIHAKITILSLGSIQLTTDIGIVLDSGTVVLLHEKGTSSVGGKIFRYNVQRPVRLATITTLFQLVLLLIHQPVGLLVLQLVLQLVLLDLYLVTVKTFLEHG